MNTKSKTHNAKTASLRKKNTSPERIAEEVASAADAKKKVEAKASAPELEQYSTGTHEKHFTAAQLNTKKPQGKLQFKSMAVTPKEARAMLEKNKLDNVRNIRRPTVEMYRKDMNAGEWQDTGEAIKLDHEGNLLDGFHRLNALAGATCKSITLSFVRGVSRSAAVVMDGGLKRSLSQTLAKGARQANAGAIVSGIKAWSKLYGSEAGTELSNAKIKDILDGDATTWEHAAEQAVEVFKNGIKGVAKATLVAFIYEALSNNSSTDKNYNKVISWTQAVATGEAQNGEADAVAFRNYLIKRHGGNKLTAGEQIFAITDAWNTYAAGKAYKGRVPRDFPTSLVKAASEVAEPAEL